MNTGTRIPKDQIRYPKNEGIRIPFSSAMDLTMKFGALPIYVFAHKYSTTGDRFQHLDRNGSEGRHHAL